MTIFPSEQCQKESDEAVREFNNGLLTEHQLIVILDFLGTSHMYDICVVTGRCIKTFHPK